jgi:hypothetical protein
MDKPFTISQDVFKKRHPDITVIPLLEHEPHTSVQLDAFVGDTHLNAIGVAAAYEKCKLVCIALASPLNVVVFRFSAPKSSSGKQSKKNKIPAISPARATLAEILGDSQLQKHGLNLDRLATSLFLDHQLRLAEGFDLRTLAPMKKQKKGPLEDLVKALGGWEMLTNRDILRDLFSNERYSVQATGLLAMRAWACVMAGTRANAASEVARSLKYNTVDFNVLVRQTSNLSDMFSQTFL